MWAPAAVIDPQIAGTPSVAFIRCLVRRSLRAHSEQDGFDETFALPVGLRGCKGLGADRVFQIQSPTGLSPVIER